MRVCGLDPSLAAFGVAVPGRVFAIRPPPALKGAARLLFIRRQIARTISAESIDLAVVEAPFSRFNTATRAISELMGVLHLTLHEMAIPWFEVPPKTLKLFATGSGAADKAAMLDAARTRSKLTIVGHDEADAFFLFALGMHVTGRPLFELSGRQRSALDAVVVPNGVARRARLSA